MFRVFSSVQKSPFVKLLPNTPTLIGCFKRQSRMPTVRAPPPGSSSLFRTAPVRVLSLYPEDAVVFRHQTVSYHFLFTRKIIVNYVGVVALVVSRSLKPRSSDAFYFSAKVKRSLSIELLMDFLVTLGPGAVRKSRREEAQWRGFIEGVGRVVGLTTTRDVRGIFDCADKFETLRLLLAAAAAAAGAGAGAGARIQTGTPVLIPGGLLRLRAAALIQHDPWYNHTYIQTTFPKDEFLKVTTLSKFDFLYLFSRKAPLHITHSWHILNIFQQAQVFLSESEENLWNIFSGNKWLLRTLLYLFFHILCRLKCVKVEFYWPVHGLPASIGDTWWYLSNWGMQCAESPFIFQDSTESEEMGLK